MEYISQTEEIYKYLEYNLGLNSMRSMVNMKYSFNNDLNLIGCFLRDYLIAKSDKKIENDTNIYDEFVLFFERESAILPTEYIVNEIIKYSKYYLSIVFEDFKDDDLMIAVSTINSCFALEYYPIIMKLMDEFYSGSINQTRFKIMLESVVDVAIKNFEQTDILEIEPCELEAQIKKTARLKIRILEGALV